LNKALNKQDAALIERLNQHPKLRHRMKELLDVVENTAGDCTKADDAEQYVIDELRKMGNDALSSWAEKAAIDAASGLNKKTQELCKDGKKR
jgi:uncharacterized protein HemY